MTLDFSSRILLVTPAPRGSRKGNRITADNWSRVMRQLGHRVTVAERFTRQECEILVALHARRSASSIAAFHTEYPNLPIIVVLTGTDIYQDIHVNDSARTSLDIATRIVVLQPNAKKQLRKRWRDKAHVIFQSATPARRKVNRLKNKFEVTVVGHLRGVKDPFRTAMASRILPSSSKISITHIGSALSDGMERRAQAEMQRNRRYRWLGDVPHWRAKRLIARSRLMVLSSRIEGGSNVLSEAIAARVPVVASRIPGLRGVLGESYKGYFEFRDTAALAKLLIQAETDQSFSRTLKQQCAELADLVDPSRERASWRTLLEECSLSL